LLGRQRRHQVRKVAFDDLLGAAHVEKGLKPQHARPLLRSRFRPPELDEEQLQQRRLDAGLITAAGCLSHAACRPGLVTAYRFDQCGYQAVFDRGREMGNFEL